LETGRKLLLTSLRNFQHRSSAVTNGNRNVGELRDVNIIVIIVPADGRRRPSIAA